ncbi:MAG: hypothetical protein KC517_05705 [Bacteroidetes bacterium]|jgi:hypothetical protein|nr:hypothetical protein [Bacteroidota bacterium]
MQERKMKSVLNYKAILMSVLAFVLYVNSNAQAVKVEVKKVNGDWELYRDGKPYYIKGVGGQVYLDKAVEIGSNSIRTWSLENAKKFLDAAHERGLTVMMGLWVQHERHGFDYNDTTAVRKQLEYFTRKVKEFKDHPALLMWGVGNEVDLFYSNTKVWNAVQDICAMVHRIDPNHPTTTVTAGYDSTETALILQNVPDLDIYGVNTYGDLKKAVDDMHRFGWPGAYLIAEWGPNGHWETAKTKWGAPIEQTSSEKADSYEERNNYINADSLKCVGSYVFLWGQKQETTATWYGMFSAAGESTESVDRLHIDWRGEKPKNESPKVVDFALLYDSKPIPDNIVESGRRYTVIANFNDPDGDKLKIDWQVISESTDVKAGGDVESAPPSIPGLIKSKQKNKMEFVAPQKEGAYRVFVFAYDRKGQMGYFNIPFYVKPDPNATTTIKLKKRKLNFEY